MLLFFKYIFLYEKFLGGWTGTPNAANQYPRPGYPPGSQPPQNWSQGPPRSMSPSHSGQPPPQWEQHRYPPQGQTYGAQQVSVFLFIKK